MSLPETKAYSPREEKLNIASHALGFVLSLFGTFILVVKALPLQQPKFLISAIVFGVSLLLLYAASTIYHSAQVPSKRARLRVFDHCSIFILIAGTYTPFALLVLESELGTAILVTVWSLAAIGISLKIFFTGRFKIVSTATYLVMGWLIVFAWETLVANLPKTGTLWLIAGGLAYTIGAVLYGIKSLKFNHAIFHIFVLVGSICHFISVYYFVLDLN